MPTAAEPTTLTIALVGNPNTGKSTLFSALAGVHQRTGNYPGVTVEKKVGYVEVEGRKIELIDLPGTYSLAPRSPDEMVAVDVLLGRREHSRPVDAVLSIIDANNLERNLYLLSQVLDMGLPTVVALNMVDVARSRGVAIDVAKLRERLGVPVVEIQANRRLGIKELKQTLAKVTEFEAKVHESTFPEAFQSEVTQLQSSLKSDSHGNHALPRFLVERLLLDSSGYLQELLLGRTTDQQHPELQAARERLHKAGAPVPAVEAMSRYGWVGRTLEGIVARPKQRIVTQGDRIDKILTHKFFGTLVFAALMMLMFMSVFLFADPIMGFIEDVVGSIGEFLGDKMPDGALKSLVVDGIIGGIGGVIVFLPQILILFFFIAVLEDCGYMARAAYLMDKLMTRVGLSGKSFIPMLSSFACAIPGVMAARVIENRRDRLTTILVAPLMSCSARLPVYALMIALFVPENSYVVRGFILFAMYALGIIVAAAVAFVLKSTVFRGPTPPFVMELPTYKWPSPRLVVGRMLERGWRFVHDAGGIILATTLVVWAAGYYPHNVEVVEGPFATQKAEVEAKLAAATTEIAKTAAAEQQANLDHAIAAAYQKQSILGRLGHFIEPAVRPLGWDWRIGCAAIASFPAREVVVSALGVIYSIGSDADETRLSEKLQTVTWEGTDRKVYNIPVALSIMVFFALCAQCAATLAVIKRETNSWRWPIFTFVYMTTLAYLGALVTYQVGMLIAT